jgi:iron complex transport system permease protein
VKGVFFAIAVFAAVFFLELLCGVSGFGLPDFYLPPEIIADDPFAAGEVQSTLFAANEINPIFKLRLLRSAAALITGGSLALAGLLLQSVLKNPLAEPFILGISGGAAVGAGIMIFTGAAALCAFAASAGAFGGALAVLFILMIMTGRNKTGESFLLSGVMTGAAAGALLMVMTALCNDTGRIAAMTRWMMGDLQTPQVELLIPAVVTALAALLVSCSKAKILNLISMGDGMAFHLGCDPVKNGRFFICTAALLTAVTVALAGIIGFCGLVVPHIVKKVMGHDHRKTVLPVFFWGGSFLGICDCLSSGVIMGKTLPVGVVTTLAGAPVFIWILNRRRQK